MTPRSWSDPDDGVRRFNELYHAVTVEVARVEAQTTTFEDPGFTARLDVILSRFQLEGDGEHQRKVHHARYTRGFTVAHEHVQRVHREDRSQDYEERDRPGHQRGDAVVHGGVQQFRAGDRRRRRGHAYRDAG